VTTDQFKVGDDVTLCHARHPDRANMRVRVVGPYEWRFVKEAHALKTYAVQDADGRILAA
jgi:hypothetical protein